MHSQPLGLLTGSTSRPQCQTAQRGFLFTLHFGYFQLCCSFVLWSNQFSHLISASPLCDSPHLLKLFFPNRNIHLKNAFKTTFFRMNHFSVPSSKPQLKQEQKDGVLSEGPIWGNIWVCQCERLKYAEVFYLEQTFLCVWHFGHSVCLLHLSNFNGRSRQNRVAQ